MIELMSALALVAVIEGLFLFVAPGGWKRAAEILYALPDTRLRVFGAIVVALGLASLWVVRVA